MGDGVQYHKWCPRKHTQFHTRKASQVSDSSNMAADYRLFLDAKKLGKKHDRTRLSFHLSLSLLQWLICPTDTRNTSATLRFSGRKKRRHLLGWLLTRLFSLWRLRRKLAYVVITWLFQPLESLQLTFPASLPSIPSCVFSPTFLSTPLPVLEPYFHGRFRSDCMSTLVRRVELPKTPASLIDKRPEKISENRFTLALTLNLPFDEKKLSSTSPAGPRAEAQQDIACVQDTNNSLSPSFWTLFCNASFCFFVVRWALSFEV